MSAGPSWNKVQRLKTTSGKRQSKSQVPLISSQLKSKLVFQQTEDKLKESICPEGKLERSSFGSRCQGASGNNLFLNFQSVKIIKEDADEDSASDLSDSERIPILPSPLTPPDLNLRAEEIDPVYFDLHPDQGHAHPEYYYPDFLPLPFNSWDLREMALLLNSENKSEAMPQTGGLLGKYLDRLIQLEWLQAQTIRSEKGKGAKARPPTAPATFWALKSPGKSKLIATALSKPLSHQEGASRSAPSRKKDSHHDEAHPSYYTFQTSPRPVDVLGSCRLCSQKQPLEIKTEEKKKKSNKSTKLQGVDFACSDSSSKIQTNGNLRIPKQSVAILDTVDSCKTSKTQAHANLKKKGNINNCGHSNIAGEKKLKTNGVKQNTCKFK
ncbi:protein FAM217B [Choloepus didactylus]|uniref:protein FAM217B n=1 Tax=Choloepus didactylus TaxID=27675 RepID=UPI00189D71DF|nr:protein FAM217B [Choloepus didactylus]XP_037667593.1 protein FAM217B [Choloepus didactylus]